MFSVKSNNHKWTELAAKELKWSGTRRIKSARAKLTWLLDSRASFSTFLFPWELVCMLNRKPPMSSDKNFKLLSREKRLLEA